MSQSSLMCLILKLRADVLVHVHVFEGFHVLVHVLWKVSELFLNGFEWL